MNRGFVLFLFLSTLLILSAVTIYAYFENILEKEVEGILEVDNLFGKFDESIETSGDWGSINNPYLIYENRHLKNLYILQNSKDITLINSNTYFKVASVYNMPVYVGGTESLLEINSIGSEDFPFQANLTGAINEVNKVLLPSNELSNTSVIGNIMVIGYPNQFDIGLFGNCQNAKISNLVLCNIQIYFSSFSTNKDNHLDYFNENHETNHVGILAGHVSDSLIENISVYYSMDSNKKAIVEAFVFEEGTSNLNYTTSGGIIGFYINIQTNENEESVSSNTMQNDIGGGVSGLGLGIIYTNDLWDYINTNGTEFILQETLDLYTIESNKKYFQIGVFTFVHSTQTKSRDLITKLWKNEFDNLWTISQTYTRSDLNYTQTYGVEATKYTLTKVTSSHFNNNNTLITTEGRNNNGFGLNNYRFMITITIDEITYALVKVGSSAMAIKIDLDNFIIPTKELKYYTFRVATSRSSNLNYPPYEQYAAYTYGSNQALRKDTDTLQYYIYGENKLKEGSTTTYGESERPLRIYYQSNSGTISFIAAAAENNNIQEGIKLNSNGDYFGFQRYSNNTTSSMHIGFTEGNGFYARNNASIIFNLYAVRITNDTQTNDHDGVNESPVITNLYKEVNIANDGITFDMSQMVLKYTGNSSSSNNNLKYQYDLITLESLNWANNLDEQIRSADSVIKMGDPSVYYYISGILRGVVSKIDAPNKGSGTISVPEGSIGFTLNGTSIPNSTSKICVVVATEPTELINQVISVSYFPKNSSGSINGDRIIHSSFVLPPVPQTTQSIPITVSYQSTAYTAYPNFNRLLICYEFDVPSTNTNTFFLEASLGSLNVVYLSVERTASIDNNPDHINDCTFSSLSGIDFITSTNNELDTVTSPNYIKTLICPYFGLTLKEIDLHAYNFKYSISRYYLDEMFYLNIFVYIIDFNNQITFSECQEIMNQMNFNYSSNSFLDQENLIYCNSDKVTININGIEVDFLTIFNLLN